jgi:glycosyltransferase involved in cell wall biosynthesis
VKAVEVPFGFYPDPVGGTEVYVRSLARHLLRAGTDVLVAAPGERSAAYDHDQLRVRRFATRAHVDDVSELYDAGDAVAAAEFGRILDEELPDVVHLHASTRAVSLRLARAVKARTLPLVFTYHTPTVTCQRGTLVRWGTEICSGEMELRTCARCALHGLGMSRPASLAVGSLPTAIGRAIGAVGLAGSGWTAMRMSELVALRHSTMRAFLAEVDHIVAPSEWTARLLERNRVSRRKITVSPQGVDLEGEPGAPAPPPGPFRIAFLGRLERIKAPDVLVRAVRSLPDASLELHVYGIVQGVAGEAYLAELKRLAAGDPRIWFLPPLESTRMVEVLRGAHVLAVPSRCLETGPLVVLEAFAAGIPVVGSNLGGIAERIRHEVDGLLVEMDSLAAWRDALLRLVEDRPFYEKLRSAVRPPRRMAEVAREMGALYETLIRAGRC